MTTLNQNDFTTVFNDDFTKDTSLNKSIWGDSWGSPSNYWFSDSPAGLLLAGQSSNGYAPVGFMQTPSGKSAGEGYGLYQFTGYAAQAGQGAGICFVMWRADNVWIDSSNPGVMTEIDILESWDGTKTGQATDHYWSNSVSGNDGQIFHTLTGVDITKSHTYAMDWERGSLTFYVDGQEMYQITGASVPKDYADGGCNETMGAEVVNETGPVGLYVQDMSYSKPNSAGGSNPTPTGPSTPASGVSLSAPGSVSAAAGAKVSVTETATISGSVGSFYEATFTAAGQQETAWQKVTVQNGKPTTFTATFASSGDYVEAVDSTSNPSFTGKSSAITINSAVSTPPPPPPPPVTPTITLSAPGSVQEASVGAGVTVTETATVTNASTVYYEVLTASGAVESGWQAASVSNGKASFSVKLDKTGDIVEAVDNKTSPTVTAKSAAVTITDPPPAVGSGNPPSGGGSTGGGSTGGGSTGGGSTGGGSTGSTPTSGSAVIGQSASSGQLSFKAVETISGSTTKVALDITKAMGGKTTVREWLDGKYIGTLWDSMPDGTNSVSLTGLAAGQHTLELTLDGSSVTATAAVNVLSASQLAGGSTGSSGGTSGSSSTITTPVSTPQPTITLSMPGSLQEASAGAGVSVSETATVSGVSTIYEEVLTKSGTVESGWQAVSVSDGQAHFSVHMAASGDYVEAVDNTGKPTVTAKSAAVTITDPAPTTPANGSTVLGTSAASHALSFSVVENTTSSGTTVDLDVTKAMGGNTTLREWFDGKYIGTLRDGMPDGTSTLKIANPSAGAHTILLTLDGSSVTATANFTMPSLSAVAHAATVSAVTDFTATAAASTAIGGGSAAAGSLPATSGGSASDLLAVATATQTTALHTIGQST